MGAFDAFAKCFGDARATDPDEPTDNVDFAAYRVMDLDLWKKMNLFG